MSPIDKYTTGIINFYKPTGFTCAEFVTNFVKKRFNFKKIGYSGTLDKFAEGVLPVLINKATKISKFLEAEDKEYVAKIKFGSQTDTLDINGDVVKVDKNYKLDVPKLLVVLQKFIGEIYQMPPKFSAIKINGERASDIVREGKEVKLKPRKINIYNIEVLSFDLDNNIVEIKVFCSKGTYIRALARDVAKKLNTGATVIKLIRERSGIFNAKDAVRKEELEKINDITEIKIYTLNNVLLRYPSLTIKTKYIQHLKYGNKLNRFMFIDYGDNVNNGIYRIIDTDNELLAMVEYKDEKFYYLRVFD